MSTLTGTQVLLLVASETGHVYTFATPKLQPLITKPEGKNLIQACLNAPDAQEYDVPVMVSCGMPTNAPSYYPSYASMPQVHGHGLHNSATSSTNMSHSRMPEEEHGGMYGSTSHQMASNNGANLQQGVYAPQSNSGVNRNPQSHQVPKSAPYYYPQSNAAYPPQSTAQHPAYWSQSAGAPQNAPMAIPNNPPMSSSSQPSAGPHAFNGSQSGTAEPSQEELRT